MSTSAFEREFLKLAGTMLACTLEMQGGEIPGRKLYRSPGQSREIRRRNLEFSALGLVDHCSEMRLLCQEAVARTHRKGQGGSSGAPRLDKATGRV